MRNDNYVYFANKNLDEFDTFVTNAGIYSTPVRGYEAVSVAGKNGDVLFEKNKYENVLHTYPVIIKGNFNENFAALKSFMLSQQGYQRLSDTFYPEEFYMATFKSFDNIRQPFLDGQIGSCVLTFDRKPQRFLRSGEQAVEVTDGSTIKNPTRFDAKPIIRVYGDGQIIINGKYRMDYVDLSENPPEYVDIDCEIQEVLEEGKNVYLTVYGDFPVLESGINEFQISGFDKVVIIPRWWKL